MQKAKLNSSAIKLINDLLRSGMTIKEVNKALGLSINWIYPSLRKMNKPIVQQIGGYPLTEEARQEKINKIKEIML